MVLNINKELEIYKKNNFSLESDNVRIKEEKANLENNALDFNFTENNLKQTNESLSKENEHLKGGIEEYKSQRELNKNSIFELETKLKKIKSEHTTLIKNNNELIGAHNDLKKDQNNFIEKQETDKNTILNLQKQIDSKTNKNYTQEVNKIIDLIKSQYSLPDSKTAELLYLVYANGKGLINQTELLRRLEINRNQLDELITSLDDIIKSEHSSGKWIVKFLNDIILKDFILSLKSNV
jgi:chromosome segregation ATPase